LKTIKISKKRGYLVSSAMSRNKREGYYLAKLRNLIFDNGTWRGVGKRRFVRGAARIDSRCKFRTAGG